MKQNFIKNRQAKTIFYFTLCSLILGLFQFTTNAQTTATQLLGIGSNVKDVAVDSNSGTVFITKNDGTLHSSTNGFNFSAIALPPRTDVISGSCSFPVIGVRVTTTEYRADRITVAPNGTLWAILNRSVTVTVCGVSTGTLITKHLYRRSGSNWIERVNAPNPTDVSVSQSNSFLPVRTIYVTSGNSPQSVFYTGDETGTSNFVNLNASGFVRVGGGLNNTAIAIGGNGTVWGYYPFVLPPASNWQLFNAINGIGDISINRLTGRIWLAKQNQFNGTLWYSDNNGVTFTQLFINGNQAQGFQNIAVASNGILYGAGFNGTLWRFQ